MFHRRNRIVLAAGITIAVIGAMASPASARASTGADPRSPTAAAAAGPAQAADSPVAPFLWGAATSSYQVEGGIHCAQPPSGGPAWTSFTQAQIPGVPCNDFDFFNGNPGIQARVRATSSLAGPAIDLAPAETATVAADNFWDPAVYRHDFDNARMLGLNSFRISLEWSRIEPQPGVFDQGAIDGYVQMLKEMRLRGLTPVVTLDHFTLPIWALMPPQGPLPSGSDPGFQSSLQGWENPALVDAFVDYVNHVVPAMKDLVGIWLTLNEPVLSQLVVGYFAGVWSPGFLLAGDRIKKALFNLISAHVRAYDAIKAIYGATPVKVGFAQAMAAVVPAVPNLVTFGDNHPAAANFDYFGNDFFVNAVVNGQFDEGYLNDPATRSQVVNHPEWAHHLDFLGINYYRRFHVYHDNVVALTASFIGGAAKNNLFGESEPHGLLNDLGWEIYPQGLYDMIMRAKNQWNMPVLITENGLPERADRNRGPYIVAHVDQVRKAMQSGATVLGYMYWSLMDNWELQSNYQPESQFGLFHIDPAGRNQNPPDLHRELTEGALAYKELIDESEATDPAGAPTQAAVNSASARFGSIQPDGSAVIPPTQTHGRYWQGNGVNLYLGFRDADSAITGLIAFGSPGSLDWNRVDLVNDSSGHAVLRESWFDDATGTPASRDHQVTYSNGTWTGTFTTGGQVTTWTASPMLGTGLWQWAAGSPWGGSQFSVEDHEGHYAGKYLTFADPNVPNAQPMGPMWRELAQVQFDQRLRLKAGDPAEPSLDLFDLSLDLQGSTQATTADLHSGTWTASKNFNPFNLTCALPAPFNFLCGGPLASTGYPPPVFFWTGSRDDNPGSPFAFDEGSKVFLGYPASHPDVTSQYRKEHDPTSVMPLDNFQFTPLSIFPPALPSISFEAGGRAYSATTDLSVCLVVSCTGSWHDIAGRVANRLPERFPPFAGPGADRTVEANAIGGANVQLDASASFDLDGRPLTFTWTGDFGTVTSSTATVFLGLSPSGGPATHRVCLTVDNGIASATRCVNITVILAPTKTSLSSSQNPSVFGQAVTFTATLVASGAGTPTGSVTFADGGTTLGTGALSGGLATFTTSTLGAGSHTMTASYGGDSEFAGSTGSLTQVVNQAPTTTSLSSSQDPSAVGAQVTYTATISPAPDGGSVAFTDGGTTITGCGSQPAGSGTATCTLTYTSTGSHSIAASYSGDANFTASTSPTLGQAVAQCGTTLSTCNLSGANLTNANLSGQNLSGTNFKTTNLSGANLSNANLSGANLSGANLSGANLSSANLSGANLKGANLSNANLTNADLTGANTSAAQLSGAILNGVTWLNTVCPDGTNSSNDGGTCLGHL